MMIKTADGISFKGVGSATSNTGSEEVKSESMQVDTGGQQLLSIVPNGENLRVGLILGPGVLFSFAHVGVLKAFEEAKVPVTAVVGLEWGSLVAAIYARRGEAFDVEWQMLKLKESFLPTKGFLSEKIKSQSAQSLDEYLEKVFFEEKIENAKLFFACPSQNLEEVEGKTPDVTWRQNGSFFENLKYCLSYLPYYKAYNNQVAATFSLKQAAEKLRTQGANRVFFIDVLASPVSIKDKQNAANLAIYLLWQQGRKLLEKQRLFVDEYLPVDMKDYFFLDYDKRREMIETGYQSGKGLVEQMNRKYGF